MANQGLSGSNAAKHDTPGAVGPSGIVPTQLASQQSQAAGKGKVDLSSIGQSLAVQVGEKDAAAAKAGSPSKGVPTSHTGSSASGVWDASGGAGPSAFAPDALTSQQSQALGKARADQRSLALIAEAATTAGRSGEAPDAGLVASPSRQEGPGPSRSSISQTPAFDSYASAIEAATERPFPPVPAVSTDEEPSRHLATLPTAFVDGDAPDVRVPDAPRGRSASVPMDAVAATPASCAKWRLTRSGIAPLGTGAAQGAASLGAQGPRRSSVLGGDRASVAAGLANGHAAVAGARATAAAEATEWERRARDARERMGALGRQAHALRHDAEMAAADLAFARTRRAEARARHVEGLAALAAADARQAEEARSAWLRREEGEAASEAAIAARLNAIDPDGLLSRAMGVHDPERTDCG